MERQFLAKERLQINGEEPNQWSADTPLTPTCDRETRFNGLLEYLFPNIAQALEKFNERLIALVAFLARRRRPCIARFFGRL